MSISRLNGIPYTAQTYEPLRELVKIIGRAAVRRLVTNFEAHPPVGVDELIAWVQGAHENSKVRGALVVWIRARLGLTSAS